MTDPRTLSRTDIVKHCERLQARLEGYHSIKQDHEFYTGLLAKFDKIEADLREAAEGEDVDPIPDPKTKKGITYIILCRHPEGVTQEQIIAESAEFGEPLKPGSVSSLLSQLKRQGLAKKRGRLFMPIK